MLLKASQEEAGPLDSRTLLISLLQPPPAIRSGSPRRVIDVNGTPVRIPKLAVRNRRTDSSDSDGKPPSDLNQPSTMPYARSEAASSDSVSLRSHTRISTPSSSRSVSDEAIATRRSMPTDNAAKTSSQPAKKKKRGVLGFLTLKEPSTSAWAEFAEAEKAKARQKGVDTTEKGLPGVSTQKLPTYVPKVNSKWDGLPESANRKSVDSKTSSHVHRDSTLSSSTRQSNWTAITSTSVGSIDTTRRIGNPHYSIDSAHRPPLQTSAPWSPDDWRTSSRGSASYPQRQPIEETDENKPQTFLLPPSPEGHDKILLDDPPALLSPLSPLTPPELDPDEYRHWQESAARASQESEKAAEMPATPPAVTEAEPMLLGIHYPEMESPVRTGSTAAYDFECSDTLSKKPEVVTPLSVDSRHRTINFSRPRSRVAGHQLREKIQSASIDEVAGRPESTEPMPLSPTLKAPDGNVEPFLTDTFANYSRQTGHIPQREASTRDPNPKLVIEESAPAKEDDEEEEDNEGFQYPDEPDFGEDSLVEVRANFAPSSASQPQEHSARAESPDSIAPSVAPSAMSETWKLSPKERLGLGSKVRKSEVLPWEVAEDLPHMQVAESESKRKRLSLRLSSKR